MKVDISEYIAKQSNIGWSPSDSVKFALCLRNILGNCEIDYDEDSEENWVRIMRKNECIAVIHAKKKIVFLKEDACRFPPTDDAFLIGSFDEEIIIDKVLFKEVFNRKFPSEYGYDDMSINDLYAFTSTS